MIIISINFFLSSAVCPNGQVWNQTSASCRICPAGTFKNGEECEDCFENTTSSSGTNHCFPSKWFRPKLGQVVIPHAKQTQVYMSPIMRKPAFCICENKDADQLLGIREADQRLCFRYMDSTIPLLSKSESSSI